MLRMRLVPAVAVLAIGPLLLASTQAVRAVSSRAPAASGPPTFAAAPRTSGVVPDLTKLRLRPGVTGDDATLTGVTCLSAASCLSSGFFLAAAEGGFVFGLAESWNGHYWGMQVVSGLDTKDNVTDALAVSCGGPGTCMLVGEHFSKPNLPVQFAELLDGSPLIWNNPAKVKWSLLDDVKCVGPAFCLAVGSYSATAGGGRDFAQRWNGSRWHRLVVPSPAGSVTSDLSALSCLSARDCQAVGVRQTRARHLVSFTGHWDGRRWSLANLPSVRGQRITALNDLSCTAPGSCVAVGFAGSRSLRPLVMRLSKGKWTFDRTPRLGTASLLGISCPTSSECLAVGSRGNLPLAERWNGSKWTVIAPVRTGGARPDDTLAHIACISAAHCVAVGVRYNARHSLSNNTLIEVWHGSAWKIQRSVNP